MIYFIKKESGPIKIGHSSRLVERLKGLQAASDGRLSVLAVIDGGFDEERALHVRFEHLRIEPTHKCEWFRPEDELLRFIAQVGRRWEPSDDAPVEPLPNIFVLTGSEDFQAWMAELAAHIGSPVTVMVERAMRELARKEEFRGPPRRIP